MHPNDADGRPTRRQTLQATLGGAATLTVGTGLTVAAGGGGGDDGDDGECDATEDEYLAVRDEYADPDVFESALEPLDGFRADLEAHDVESREVHEVTVRVRTVDCEPVPEYLALWTTGGGGGVSLKLRPETGAYQARYVPDIGRGDDGGGDTTCYRIGTEDSLGCPEWRECCTCSRTYLESGCDVPDRPCYKFCIKTCDWDCDWCPTFCGIKVPHEDVPVA